MKYFDRQVKAAKILCWGVGEQIKEKDKDEEGRKLGDRTNIVADLEIIFHEPWQIKTDGQTGKEIMRLG